MNNLKELNRAFKLLLALDDVKKFNKLSTKNKFEALRLHTIQNIHIRHTYE